VRRDQETRKRRVAIDGDGDSRGRHLAAAQTIGSEGNGLALRDRSTAGRAHRLPIEVLVLRAG